jgi:hypothetical protein
MTTAAFFIPARNTPVRHPDGSINFAFYREVAIAERRKASQQFWSLIAVGLKPPSARPLMRGYATRLG